MSFILRVLARSFRFFLWFFLLSIAGCSDSASRKDQQNPPSLIIITIDALRADFVGSYGNQDNLTPFLDNLAKQGVLFEFAYSQSAKTLPSHASLMTSMYYNCHLATQDPGASFRLSEDELTLAEILSEQGFATGASTDGGFTSARFGLNQGFEFYSEPDILQQREDRTNPTAGIIQVNRRALEWLDTIPKNQPYFLFLHYYDVHSFIHDIPGSLSTKRALMSGEKEPTEELINEMKAAYANRLRNFDRELEKLFVDLQARNRLDSTFVFITSDHGEGFGEHGWFGHGIALEQQAIWVPLILVGPDLPQGIRMREPAQNLDVMPTALELLSLPLPGGMQGSSLLPWVFGWSQEPRVAISEVDKPGGAKTIISTSKKLFWYPGKTPEFKLFDLENDPGERIDIAPEHPELVIAMHNRLLDLIDCRGNQVDIETTLRRPPSKIEWETLEALGYFKE